MHAARAGSTGGLPRSEPVPYGELPFDRSRVEVLRDVLGKLEAQGFEIPSREQLTPQALGAYQKAEIEKWWPVVKAADIKPD